MCNHEWEWIGAAVGSAEQWTDSHGQTHVAYTTAALRHCRKCKTIEQRSDESDWWQWERKDGD